MRKVENVKVIPERKQVTVTYYGNCPVCGFEQIYNYMSKDLDKECSECKQKRLKKEKQEFLDNYIGATVLKIEEDNRIIIKLKDGRVYALHNITDIYEGKCEGCTRIWDIEQIHEGDASWFE